MLLITIIVVINIFLSEYNDVGTVLSQEITFKIQKEYTFSNTEFLPILSTNYFELIPLSKKCNEVNAKRTPAEKLSDPRPKVSESFKFDEAGNVTLSKEDHQEL